MWGFDYGAVGRDEERDAVVWMIYIIARVIIDGEIMECWSNGVNVDLWRGRWEWMELDVCGGLVETVLFSRWVSSLFSYYHPILYDM